MFPLQAVQKALSAYGFDGWLLYDFRGSNLLARRILQLDPRQVLSRRLFYFVPRAGQPRKLVHRIESGALDHLPGEKNDYLRWQEIESGVKSLVGGSQRVALEYSPRNANPYVSRVDAGTVELVRSCGCEVVSSGDLVQQFEAAWDEEQWTMHLAAARHTDSAYEVVWNFIAAEVRRHGATSELAVQRKIMEHFAAHSLTTDHPPIVGVGPHSGDPHYAPDATSNGAIREGDFVLVDLWAKLDRPRAVYSDLTRVGFVGQTVPAKYQELFAVVASARDAAIDTVRQALASGQALQGWQVDQACRDVIDHAGYGPHFIHRTGHNIGQETHGNGANMDNLETHEDRLVLPNTCFSIEPGIYLEEFGVRSEVNVYIDAQRGVHVTGGERQYDVVPILGR